MSIVDLESSLDLPALLEHWDVEVDSLRQSSRNEWRCNCFIHQGDGDTALSIKLVNGRLWLRCYSHNCFNGTLVDYAMQYKKMAFAQILNDYRNFQHSVKQVTNKTIKLTDYTVKFLPPNIMDRYVPSIHTDWIKLGLDRDVLLRVFMTRFCDDPNDLFYGYIVYPIRDKLGRIRSIQGRRTKVSPHTSKYMFLPDYPAKDLLFGLYEQQQIIRNSRYVVVTESPKSVMRGFQLGIPTIGLMGIQWTDAQAKMIAALNKRTILVADNDEPDQKGVSPGIDGMTGLHYYLKKYVNVEMKISPNQGTDIGDYCTVDEWKSIIGVI